jgi:hypothetical protein
MRLRIKQARPTSLNEAVRHAVELEAFNRAERKSHENHCYIRKLNSDQYECSKNQDSKLDSLIKSIEEMKNMLSMFRRQNNYQTFDKRNQENLRNQSKSMSSRTFPKRSNTNSLNCYECGKEGHNKYNCREFVSRSKRKINMLEKDCENSSNSYGSGLFVEATINGIKAYCLIDTGATLSMISSSFINRCQFPVILEPFESNIVNASGKPLEIKGRTHLDIKLNDEISTNPFIVSNIEGDAILGLDFMTARNIVIDVPNNHLIANGKKIPMNCRGPIGCNRVICHYCGMKFKKKAYIRQHCRRIHKVRESQDTGHSESVHAKSIC